MIIQYTLFLFGLIWSFSIIKTQSIFNKKVGLIEIGRGLGGR